MKGCIFCDRKSIKEDIIYETKNFFVKVGIGLTAPGHVLLITKEHYRCFAEIPEQLQEECNNIKKLIFEKIKKVFSQTIIMEAGNWGQSVPHAHIHFIPKERKASKYYKGYKITDFFKEFIIPSGYNFLEVNDDKLRDIKEKYGGYILFTDNNKSIAFPRDDNLNTENIKYRAIFNKILGLKDVPLNWENISNEIKRIDDIKRRITKERLKF